MMGTSFNWKLLSPQGRWRRVLLLAVVPAVCTLSFLAYESITFTSAPERFYRPGKASFTVTDAIRELYSPLIHPITAPEFTDFSNRVWKLPAGPNRFTKPLGKKLCILDIDTRPFDKPGELYSTGSFKWSDVSGLTAGFLHHYLYAMIHGYDYKFIRAPVYKDRFASWAKVPMFTEVLKDHDMVVFIEADAVFNHVNLPLEWLLNYWLINERNLVTMAADPNDPQNYDSFGSPVLNTGFIVFQQSERTQELIKHWAECPDETRYPGCSKWKYEWSCEQRAFGEYLRYDYNRTDDVHVLECDQANGSPYSPAKWPCSGIFVRHYWNAKVEGPRGSLEKALMETMVNRLHSSFLEDKSIVTDHRSKALNGSEIV